MSAASAAFCISALPCVFCVYEGLKGPKIWQDATLVREWRLRGELLLFSASQLWLSSPARSLAQIYKCKIPLTIHLHNILNEGFLQEQLKSSNLYLY